MSISNSNSEINTILENEIKRTQQSANASLEGGLMLYQSTLTNEQLDTVAYQRPEFDVDNSRKNMAMHRDFRRNIIGQYSQAIASLLLAKAEQETKVKELAVGKRKASSQRANLKRIEQDIVKGENMFREMAKVGFGLRCTLDDQTGYQRLIGSSEATSICTNKLSISKIGKGTLRIDLSYDLPDVDDSDKLIKQVINGGLFFTAAEIKRATAPAKKRDTDMDTAKADTSGSTIPEASQLAPKRVIHHASKAFFNDSDLMDSPEADKLFRAMFMHHFVSGNKIDQKALNDYKKEIEQLELQVA